MLRDRFYPTSQSLENPERAHRTHGNPVLVDALKKLSLEGRLKFNREIEVKNEARRMKSVDHAMGNASRPGSPTASFVTVDSEEIDLIRKEPAFLKRVFEYLGPWAINFIQARNSSDKRKMEEDAESRVVAAKKARLVPDIEEGTNDPTVISEIIFPQILFDTAKRVSGGIPLSFFTYERLSTIASDTLSTQKLRVSFLDDDGKKSTVYALDIQKLIEEWKLPKSGDKKEGLSYSEFREAAGFLLKFEAERTIGGENSNNYRWLDNHFSFWLVHRNSESLFEFWKELEFDQRMERKVYPKPFVASSYENAWSKAESNKSRSIEVKEILAAATAAAMSAASLTPPPSSLNPSTQGPLSKGDLFPSVNSFIDKEPFPTHLDTALRFAEMIYFFHTLFPDDH
ncbi:hypothetical protein DFH05DRAFT_1611592 [Lentinula detonsa]|uniref:Uncharacterized protein n=1 Tax=Lentinula detonsa TaxID=2804962 RepID=A0A9W8TXN1_9AGAR|nr:hypothetical protein DFH05DRAFT_1611592 [Lentinula detonsa]